LSASGDTKGVPSEKQNCPCNGCCRFRLSLESTLHKLAALLDPFRSPAVTQMPSRKTVFVTPCVLSRRLKTTLLQRARPCQGSPASSCSPFLRGVGFLRNLPHSLHRGGELFGERRLAAENRRLVGQCRRFRFASGVTSPGAGSHKSGRLGQRPTQVFVTLVGFSSGPRSRPVGLHTCQPRTE